MSIGMSLGAFAEGFASSRNARKDREERAEDRARQDRMLDIYEKNGMSMPDLGAIPPNGGTGTSPGEGGFPASLIQTESGGNWSARNNEVGAGGKAGHFGRLQFGQARLQDAMNAGVIPAGTTPEAFMADPEMQRRAERWHFADIDRQAARRGLTKYVGQTVSGIPITQDAIRAMAHLGGIGGAQKFLTSGGTHNPADSFGTSLADYAKRHGGVLGAHRPAY